MNTNRECEDCKYFMIGKDGTTKSFCSKNEHPTTPGTWCNGFEYPVVEDKETKMALDVNQAVYGLVRFLNEDHNNNHFPHKRTAFRAVKAFADANGISKPENYDDVTFPDYGKVMVLPELDNLT